MVNLRINGETRTVDAAGDTPLLWALRDVLGMTGTKFGCGMALCGACTVHVDGQPTRSCVLPIAAIGDRSITTIEAIGETAAAAQITLHELATKTESLEDAFLSATADSQEYRSGGPS